MVWLVGWMFVWFVGWLVGWMDGWLVVWFVGWLADWLVISLFLYNVNYFLVTTGTLFSSVTFVHFCTYICLIPKVCRWLQCPSCNIQWHTVTLRHVSDT